MGISQHDRDRIEDLGLDPQSDHTEDLYPRNAKTPEATGASRNRTAQQEIERKFPLMIAQPADIGLPSGADPEEADDWQLNPDGSRYRFIWSSPAKLPEGISDLDIRCVVCQHDDGTIPASGEDAPEVWIGGSCYSIASVFHVVNAIIQAVAQAVEWSSNARSDG